jgi:hypothetical protein
MNDLIVCDSAGKRGKHVCPAGVLNAVCTGVDDLGLQAGYQNGKPMKKIVLRFETEAIICDGALAGEPYRVSRIVSASLDEKSVLRGFLIDWFGSDPTVSNGNSRHFNTDDLVGRPAIITVIHNTSNGKVTPKVTRVSMHRSELPVLTASARSAEPPDWVRIKQALRLDKPLVSIVAETPAITPIPSTTQALFISDGGEEIVDVVEIYYDYPFKEAVCQ